MSNALANRTPQELAAAKEINDLFGVDGIQIPVDAPLPTVKIMRESPQFEMPDGTYEKSIRGHILYYTNANAFYAAAFGEGESVIPDCFSSNGIMPDGGEHMLAGPCKACPKNQFSSHADGVAKACSNTIRLYVLLDGDVLPSLIKAPPSSMSKKDSLMKWLTSAPNIAAKAGVGTAYQPIKVEFSLVKKDFESGFSASVLQIETIDVLSPAVPEQMEQIKNLARLTKQFKEMYLGRIAQDMAAEKTDDQQPITEDGLPKGNIPI